MIGPFGTTSSGHDPGALGGVQYATQNTYTGHVTLAKMFDSAACYINFFPSVAEDREDRSARGTPTNRTIGNREFQNLPAPRTCSRGGCGT